MAEESGVVIGGGRCRVRLRCAGPPAEVGYPALIEVLAGPFSGSVLDETVRFYGFREQLTTLYKDLKSEARLESLEGFLLRLVGNGSGGILVDVKVVGEHVPPMLLTFEFSIDQSYLPEIIRQLDSEFPPPYGAAT
jgi:hypothetical protein